MDNQGLSQGGSFSLNSGVLAIGTVTSAINTTATINFVTDGVFRSKTAITSGTWPVSVPATYSTPADGTFTGAVGGSVRLYVLFLDSAGVVTAVPGRISNVAELAAGTVDLQFPPVQRNKAPFGYIRIALTAGTTFVPGTTLMGAAGVTATFGQLSTIPAESLKV